MESEEAFELALPALGFEDTDCSMPVVTEVSSISGSGGVEVSRQVATLSPTHHVVHSQGVAPVVVDGLSGGTPGQAASGRSSPAEVGDSGQVAPVSFSALGGGLGQVATDTSSPVACSSLLVASVPLGGARGWWPRGLLLLRRPCWWPLRCWGGVRAGDPCTPFPPFATGAVLWGEPVRADGPAWRLG